jgi:hypothetical protein
VTAFETRGPWLRLSDGSSIIGPTWIHTGMVTAVESCEGMPGQWECCIYTVGRERPFWYSCGDNRDEGTAALLDAIAEAQKCCQASPLLSVPQVIVR